MSDNPFSEPRRRSDGDPPDAGWAPARRRLRLLPSAARRSGPGASRTPRDQRLAARQRRHRRCCNCSPVCAEYAAQPDPGNCTTCHARIA